MKKVLLLLGVFILSTQVALAQRAMKKPQFFQPGKMVASGQVGISGLGMGFGANFEYGITENIGVMPSFIIHNYSAGLVDWSFKVLDLYGTYHYKPKNASFFDPDKMDAYGMAGISLVSFGASSSTSEESSTNIAFGVGAGTRYYINNQMSVFVEGKYRLAQFKTDTYSLTVRWYSVSGGVSFAFN